MFIMRFIEYKISRNLNNYFDESKYSPKLESGSLEVFFSYYFFSLCEQTSVIIITLLYC